MFLETFNTQLSVYTTHEDLQKKLSQEIKKHYSRANRYYHNLAHLDKLLSELMPVKNQISNWEVIVFSIAYHDIIYHTLKSDNEEKSARFAADRLTSLGVDDNQRAQCVSQILATKRHEKSDHHDTNLFTDADLAILGAENKVYNTYVSMIRKEYKLYPDLVYIPGRRKALEHFLSMHEIYKTHYFREKYELQARSNIHEELQSL